MVWQLGPWGLAWFRVEVVRRQYNARKNSEFRRMSLDYLRLCRYLRVLSGHLCIYIYNYKYVYIYIYEIYIYIYICVYVCVHIRIRV